jgi:hypothetical protein
VVDERWRACRRRLLLGAVAVSVAVKIKQQDDVDLVA